MSSVVNSGRSLQERAPSSPYYRRLVPISPVDFDELPRRQILVGDALDQLRRLPKSSIDACVTSPPYYLLRDYGVPGQLGLEEHVSSWVANQRMVMREVARLLKPTGSLWLNVGDSYSRSRRYGAEAKSLLLAPERLLLKLLADGWIVRNKVVWAKPNPMPHSVGDRLKCSYEVIYFLVRSRQYYFALDAIREPHRSIRKPGTVRPGKYHLGDRAWAGPLAGSNSGLLKARAEGRPGAAGGKNPGDVWTVATGRYRGAHFATFPEQLITRPILAAVPERICQVCGTPWLRVRPSAARPAPAERSLIPPLIAVQEAAKLQPVCGHKADWVRGVVLDPFFGSGTVGVVAEALGRDWLGIELNTTYVQLAEQRLNQARRLR